MSPFFCYTINMKKHKILYVTFLLAIITIFFGTIYITLQQSLRIGANNPQIQLAQDAAESLNNGINPVSFADSRVDIVKSLSPFIIIYSKSGHAITGNGYLNNKIPTIPDGVLQNSDGKDYSFVTWQPQDKTRIASVSVSAKNYYVLSGRSLKEVEKQIQTMTVYVLLGWFSSIVLILIGYFFANKQHEKRIQNHAL